jgi:hypothetical protein
MSQSRADAFHAAASVPGAIVTLGETGATFQAVVLEALADPSYEPCGKALRLDESPFNPNVTPGTLFIIHGDEPVLAVTANDLTTSY